MVKRSWSYWKWIYHRNRPGIWYFLAGMSAVIGFIIHETLRIYN